MRCKNVGNEGLVEVLHLKGFNVLLELSNRLFVNGESCEIIKVSYKVKVCLSLSLAIIYVLSKIIGGLHI